jgi:general secretion pathway protein I
VKAQRQSPICNCSAFTLLEVLLALALVGVAVTMILQLFSSNLRNIAGSGDYVKASLRAQEKMREILDSTDLAERQWTESTTDGYRIDVAVAPVEKERVQTITGAQLLKVDLVLSWKQGVRNKTMNLSTLKYVRPSEGQKAPVTS